METYETLGTIQDTLKVRSPVRRMLFVTMMPELHGIRQSVEVDVYNALPVVMRTLQPVES